MRLNKYPGSCHWCRQEVERLKGKALLLDGNWVVAHKGCIPATEPPPDIRIEYPNKGKGYCHYRWGVYRYGVFPKSSALAGQPKRNCLGVFDTAEDALAKFPGALVVGTSPKKFNES